MAAGPITKTALERSIKTAQGKAIVEMAEVEAGTRKGVYRKKVNAGEGLYVYVDHAGARSWLLKVQKDGKALSFGLGTYDVLSLADARKKAQLIKADIAAGVDPAARERDKQKIPTFAEAAHAAHGELVAAGRGARYTDQWIKLLEHHAFRKLGKLPVNVVTEADVRGIIQPLWATKHETARKVTQRVEAVIVWATAEGHRERTLDTRVVKKSLPVAPDAGHFASMHYEDVPEFMAKLSAMTTSSAMTLQFTILTAVRPTEAREGAWAEIDMDAAVWNIPPSRMKTGKEHRVPLSAGAMDVLEFMEQRKHAGSDMIFPGMKLGKPMSDVTVSKVIKAMDLPFTVHGFRSTMRTWAAERTDVADRVAEAALAHADKNEMQGRYQRGDLFDKRRALMDMWCKHCLPTGGPAKNVVPLRA